MNPLVRFIGLPFLGSVLAAVAAAQSPVALVPRHPLPKTPVADQLSTQDARLFDDVNEVRVLVKFTDEAGVRVDSAGDVHAQANSLLTAVRSIARANAIRFAPGLDLDAMRLHSLLDRAAARSGRAQPDLFSLVEVVMPHGASLQERIDVAEALQSLTIVEFASLMPSMRPGGDIAPFTPWMQFLQTYRHPDPGIDVDLAWSLGLRGAGVRFSDVEYAWNTAHEDLVDMVVHPEPGQTPTQTAIDKWMDHGTAVLGELSSAVNGYGCSGMVPDVEMWTYPSLTIEAGGHREEDAVAAAIADSSAGDVVLIEIQSGSLTPAEVNQPMWLIVNVAKDAGVVVVAVAGNGNKNLDGSAFSDYTSWGDSGAIIVGAGTDDVEHAKLSFSTFGSRVNVQGWGQNVFSLGYGSFAQYGGDPNQKYADAFNGTSAAAGIVAAAAALLEEYAKQTLLVPLDPLVLRQLLIETGMPQSASDTKHIGPLPNLAAAIAGMPTPWLNLGGGLAGTSGIPEIAAKGSLAPLTPIEIDVDGATPAAGCWLIVGTTTDMLSFKGGTLVPHPDVILGPLQADATGGTSLAGVWPTGLLPGTLIALQWWVEDASGVKGFAASQGVLGKTP